MRRRYAPSSTKSLAANMSPLPDDLQAEFIEHLQSRYDETGPGQLLSARDIERWTEIVGSTRRHAYDVIAKHLALGFHEGRLSFWFCDAVAIAVIGFVYDDFVTQGEDSWPDFFNRVYLAFDAGEVSRPEVNPIEKFTRPMIAEIVRDLAHDTG
ncbi:hypothetical protein [Burkholderia gladioli]|uniref:hypothetical protein n=2 Tax=Burkholderia gladioli TaxID=28095 RepID=UPI001640D90A|nr:hypothetical protein [Burkholderia gladioli]MEB2549731.1 hypothetical protein [Burkholderia gladioli]